MFVKTDDYLHADEDEKGKGQKVTQIIVRIQRQAVG